MESTTTATRIIPAPPVPPACVMNLAERIAADQLKREQDAIAQAQLINLFRSELPELVGQKGLWNVVAALQTVLAEQRSPSNGREMTCTISLRDAQEANGWY